MDLRKVPLSPSKVSRGQKRDQLIEILKDCPKGEKTLVFLEMRKHVDFLATFLCQSEVRTPKINHFLLL